jgi:hypothetical protein
MTSGLKIRDTADWESALRAGGSWKLRCGDCSKRPNRTSSSIPSPTSSPELSNPVFPSVPPRRWVDEKDSRKFFGLVYFTDPT